MEKVLVTGGMGFIGSHLVNHLLALKKEVIVVDKAIHRPTYYDISKATIIEGDVLSRGLMRECFKEVDTCFHLAAIASVPACSRDWLFSHETNVVAFNGLLEEMHQLNKPIKFIYASSAAVYGNSNKLPLSENDPVCPSSTYGADKLSNEIYARVAYQQYGIPSIGLRFFNVYGPGQLKSNPYSGVITLFKLAIKAGKAIYIFGDGQQTRDFIFIDDLIQGLMAAANTPYEQIGVYNLCRGEEVSIEKLAKIMMQLKHCKVPLQHKNSRLGDLRRSLGNPALAEDSLGFVATIPIEVGLEHYLSDNTFQY